MHINGVGDTGCNDCGEVLKMQCWLGNHHLQIGILSAFQLTDSGKKSLGLLFGPLNL